MAILLLVIVYPLIIPDAPLAIIGQGTFFPPGIYVSTYDSLNAPVYILNLGDAAAKRIASKLKDEDRLAMQEWLVGAGIPESEVDRADTRKLLTQWEANFDPKQKIPGQTNARRNYFVRLNNSLKGLLSVEGAIVAAKNPQTGALEEKGVVNQSDYVNVNQVAGVRGVTAGH